MNYAWFTLRDIIMQKSSNTDAQLLNRLKKLGKQLGVVSHPTFNQIYILVFGILSLGFAGVITYIIAINRQPNSRETLTFFVGFIAILALTGLFLAFIAIRGLTTKLYVFEYGVIHKGFFNQKMMLWSEVTDFTLKPSTFMFVTPMILFTRYQFKPCTRFTFYRNDDVLMSFIYANTRFGKAFDAILTGMHDVILPQLANRLKKEQKLVFGQIIISKAGIKMKDQQIEWADIGFAELIFQDGMSPRYKYHLTSKRGKEYVCDVTKVRNHMLLDELVTKIHSRVTT